jgi:hypothetical protein
MRGIYKQGLLVASPNSSGRHIAPSKDDAGFFGIFIDVASQPFALLSWLPLVYIKLHGAKAVTAGQIQRLLFFRMAQVQ